MTEVCFVLAPGQNHFFVEVAEALEHELARLGVPAWISRHGFPAMRDDLSYVLLPPHEFRGLAPPEHWPTRGQLARTVFYCFEQPGTKHFQADIEMAKGPVGAVLDLNEASVEEMQRSGVSVHHAPVGWSPVWQRPDDPRPASGRDGLKRDLDLLHLGIYSPRRGRILARSARRLARHRTMLLFGDDHGPNAVAQANFAIGQEKWRLLNRARVLLNVHVGDRPYFEWLRVVQAVCNGVFVVSEHSTGTAPLEAGAHFAEAPPGLLVEAAERYLEDEALRAASAREALAVLRERQPLRASAELLAGVASDVARRTPVGAGVDGAVVEWPDNSAWRFRADPGASASTVASGEDFGGSAPILVRSAEDELLLGGLDRLASALDADPRAAFAWGIAQEVGENGAPRGLLSVFPWQPWRLSEGDWIGPTALWRERPLRSLLEEAEGADDLPSAGDLYRLAAARGLHGVHVAEIVVARSGTGDGIQFEPVRQSELNRDLAAERPVEGEEGALEARRQLAVARSELAVAEERLRATADALLEANQSLARIPVLEQRLEERREENVWLVGERAGLEEEIERFGRENRLLTEENATQRRHAEALEGSRSWRLLAPLRRLRSSLRR